MMERYKPIFKEWDPKAFAAARDKGLLDEPLKKYHSIPEYIQEYATDTTNNNPRIFFDKLKSIKKNKIDNARFGVRIVIYKNNFYSIGDEYREPFIHIDIIAYLVLKEGLKFNGFDDFIHFENDKHLSSYLCLILKNPNKNSAMINFSESYNRKEKAISYIEKNVNNYRNITKHISELAGGVPLKSGGETLSLGV